MAFQRQEPNRSIDLDVAATHGAASCSALVTAQEAEKELDMNTVLCKMSHSSKEAVVLATIASQKLLLKSVCSG